MVLELLFKVLSDEGRRGRNFLQIFGWSDFANLVLEHAQIVPSPIDREAPAIALTD